jgi:hypothetical protein
MSLFKERGTNDSSTKKTSRRRNWSAIDVAGYRIDVIHPERQAVGGSLSLIKTASLGIGYLLVLAAVTRAAASYLGWSVTLLAFGAAHLVFALVGLSRDSATTSDADLEPAPMGIPGWHLSQGEEAVSQTGERPGLANPRPPTVRPPAFPPRTRSVT